MAIFADRPIGRYLVSPFLLHSEIRTGLSRCVFFILNTVFVFAFAGSSLTIVAQSSWQKTAGPPGVEVDVIYKANNIVYAGTETQGVYRSSDNGSTWVKANTGIERTRVFDVIASGPNILVATAASDCPSTLDVFKSTNNGDTWTPTSGLAGRIVTSFAKKGTTVYAVFDVHQTNGNGVYRSTDDGNTWNPLPSINPVSDPDKIFISGDAIIVSASNFVMRSVDDGVTWDVVKQFAFSGIHSFAKAGTRLFAAEATGLATSNDNGETWDFTFLPDGALSLSSDGTTIYLGARDKVFKSIDFGANWTDVSNGLGNGDIKALLFDGTNLLAGTTADAAGIYRSTNGGTSWSPAAAGLPIASNIRSMITFGNYVFAGTNGDGIYRSNDRGNTWSKTDAGNALLNHQLVLSFTAKGNALFAGTDNGVFRSTDGGATFQRIHNGLPANTQVYGNSLTVSGTNLIAGLTLVVSSSELLDGIFYSTDNGDNWHQASVPNGPIYVSAVESDGSPIVYAGVYTQSGFTTGLYKSTDNGLTWRFNPAFMVDIEEISAKGSNVLASTLFTAFYSNDFGELQWIQSNLPGRPIFGTGVNTYTRRDGFIYAGNEGVYVSTNGGASWSDFRQGFPVCPNPQVQGSTFDGSYLYAGTGGEGVWRRLIGTAPSGSSPAAFDFDGDGRADISVRRSADNTWYLLRTTAGFTAMTFGVAGDLPAPADFDGDGKTDVAVFRPSENRWYIFGSVLGFYQVNWGTAGDIPVPADYDGDGKDDVAIYRPSTGTWYIVGSSAGLIVKNFGTSEDKPYPADYDGDGRADIAVRRPSDNNWYLLRTTAGYTVVAWGINGDLSAPADYDGDGKTDLAVFRPSSNTWFIFGTTRGQYTQTWGQSGDVPVAADYDGDGRSDIAVFRPSNGTWYIIGSTVGIVITNFGQSGDTPVEGVFNY